MEPVLSPPPDRPPVDEPHFAPPPVRNRPPGLLIVIGLVLLVATGGIGFGLGRASAAWGTADPPATFTVEGSMTVNGSCGSGGYSDIRAGAQVEILNQDNKVLGVSTLQKGTGSCFFTFSVRDVPTGERLYGASTGNSNRGVIWKTQQEAMAEGFHLTLG